MRAVLDFVIYMVICAFLGLLLATAFLFLLELFMDEIRYVVEPYFECIRALAGN